MAFHGFPVCLSLVNSAFAVIHLANILHCLLLTPHMYIGRVLNPHVQDKDRSGDCRRSKKVCILTSIVNNRHSTTTDGHIMTATTMIGEWKASQLGDG
jgi:hypothetical protein